MLTSADITKGYEAGEGYVPLSEADFQSLHLKSVKAIEVVEFVEASQTDVKCYDSPYFLAVDEAGHKVYRLLLVAMGKTKADTFKIKGNPDASPDKEARYGYKTKQKPFFGYKAYASMDSDSELITKLETTPGNANDSKGFHKVIDNKANLVAADKAYDTKKNHRLLKRKRGTR